MIKTIINRCALFTEQIVFSLAAQVNNAKLFLFTAVRKNSFGNVRKKPSKKSLQLISSYPDINIFFF